MKTKRLSHTIFTILVLFVSVIILSGCNPGLYKRPAEDFRTASTTLKELYFLEWELSNKALIERADIEDQIVIWSAPEGVPFMEIDRVSKKMADRRAEDVHDELRPLREQAFNALDGYASTLVSLSSKEPTARIQSELNGVVDDINGTLEVLGKLKLTEDAIIKSQKFSGPLQQYVGVINEIIEIVSSIIRERAIIETIGKSNESILELLSILKEEAVEAEKNALKQISLSLESINNYMSHEKFQQANNATKAMLAKRKAKLVTIESQIKDQNIAGTFSSAAKAQGALVEKAMLKNPGDWTLRIKQFREQVIATRMAVENIKLEM
jgi:hypothetical protein